MRNWENINIHYLREAVTKTFSKRNYSGEIYMALDIIRKSNILRPRWNTYQIRYDYAKKINFDETVACIEKIIE